MTEVSARLSADAANGLTFGTDGGLYGTAVTTNPKSGPLGLTIDNSNAAPGQAWTYALPTWNSTSAIGSLYNAGAVVWPLIVARRSRLTAALLYINAVGAGSTVYNALFAADPANALPAGRINAQWFSFPGITGGAIPATIYDTTTVLEAFVPYWVCSWVYTTSGYPTMFMRMGSTGFVGALPQLALPTATFSYTQTYLSLKNETQTWNLLTSAPATLGNTPANSTMAAGQFTYAPYLEMQLTNV